MTEQQQKLSLSTAEKLYGGLSVGAVVFLFTTFITQSNANSAHLRLEKRIDQVETSAEERRKELKHDLKEVLNELKLEFRPRRR